MKILREFTFRATGFLFGSVGAGLVLSGLSNLSEGNIAIATIRVGVSLICASIAKDCFEFASIERYKSNKNGRLGSVHANIGSRDGDGPLAGKLGVQSELSQAYQRSKNGSFVNGVNVASHSSLKDQVVDKNGNIRNPWIGKKIS